MPNWNELLDEIRAAGSMYDVVRRRYLTKLHEITKRNVIIYYSGWLQKQGVAGVEINDEDKNGFMTVVHKLDKRLGLDLVLHTPGGNTAATESLVDYLRSVFGNDIRAIVPQLAMSGGAKDHREPQRRRIHQIHRTTNVASIPADGATGRRARTLTN